MASILQYVLTSCGLTFVNIIYALFSVFLFKFPYVSFTLQLVAGPFLWSLGFDFWPVFVCGGVCYKQSVIGKDFSQNIYVLPCQIPSTKIAIHV
jgi:hypothetical protein